MWLAGFLFGALIVAQAGAPAQAPSAPAPLDRIVPGGVPPARQLLWEPRTGAISRARDLARWRSARAIVRSPVRREWRAGCPA